MAESSPTVQAPPIDVSVIIPARQEIFLARTIEDVIRNARANTEVIAVCDGYWPDPAIQDHLRVNLLHYSESIGQRAATNAGVRAARGKYVMKLDAHCAVGEGFDAKLMAPYESGELTADTTTIPRMYNLHGFDWVCPDGHRRYQGPPDPCTECGQPVTREIVWLPRKSRRTDFARFDKNLHFQYWKRYNRRPEAQGKLADVMCSVGACWFQTRDRYLELGGLDERHGSWGQVGVEVACKAWLSGGRQVVNKRTWFGHMFRTQGKGFTFPYPIRNSDIAAARGFSSWLWAEGNWEMAVRPLEWILEKFHPVPDWHAG
jgi:glycosyltransferase involved in cell wall biosynthesis